MEQAPYLSIDPDDARAKLAELDLTPEPLWEALKHGWSHAADCTSHDPGYVRAFLPTGKTTRGLRDQLVRKGWKVDDDMNYPLTIHPEARLALVVATGDGQTASDTGPQPRNRSPKGPATKRAIDLNQLSFAGMEPHPSVWELRPTWMLLYRFNIPGAQIKAELSYPIRFNKDGYVTGWGERIILPDAPPSVELRSLTDSQPPIIEPAIIVERKRMTI